MHHVPYAVKYRYKSTSSQRTNGINGNKSRSKSTLKRGSRSRREVRIPSGLSDSRTKLRTSRTSTNPKRRKPKPSIINGYVKTEAVPLITPSRMELESPISISPGSFSIASDACPELRRYPRSRIDSRSSRHSSALTINSSFSSYVPTSSESSTSILSQTTTGTTDTSIYSTPSTSMSSTISSRIDVIPTRGRRRPPFCRLSIESSECDYISYRCTLKSPPAVHEDAIPMKYLKEVPGSTAKKCNVFLSYKKGDEWKLLAMTPPTHRTRMQIYIWNQKHDQWVSQPINWEDSEGFDIHYPNAPETVAIDGEREVMYFMSDGMTFDLVDFEWNAKVLCPKEKKSKDDENESAFDMKDSRILFIGDTICEFHGVVQLEHDSGLRYLSADPLDRSMDRGKWRKKHINQDKRFVGLEVVYCDWLQTLFVFGGQQTERTEEQKKKKIDEWDGKEKSRSFRASSLDIEKWPNNRSAYHCYIGHRRGRGPSLSRKGSNSSSSSSSSSTSSNISSSSKGKLTPRLNSKKKRLNTVTTSNTTNNSSGHRLKRPFRWMLYKEDIEDLYHHSMRSDAVFQHIAIILHFHEGIGGDSSIDIWVWDILFERSWRCPKFCDFKYEDFEDVLIATMEDRYIHLFDRLMRNHAVIDSIDIMKMKPKDGTESFMDIVSRDYRNFISGWCRKRGRGKLNGEKKIQRLIQQFSFELASYFK